MFNVFGVEYPDQSVNSRLHRTRKEAEDQMDEIHKHQNWPIASDMNAFGMRVREYKLSETKPEFCAHDLG